MSAPITLAFFDFDGTLFLSPEPPQGEDPAQWWTSSKSLYPPFVPDKPGRGWWNVSVVEKAKEAFENPDVISVLVTGRRKAGFSLRIKELLAQAGIKFHHIYMSSGGPTEEYKIKAINELLREYPTIRGVSIWEDRMQHLRSFVDAVESQGKACFPHLITVAAHPIDAPSARNVAAKYQEKKKVKTKDGDEATVYVYSEKQLANRDKEKATQVEKLRKGIGDLRSCVKKDMKSKDPHKKMVALAVALMDHTLERVGNSGSAEDGHYGVTGWEKSHISIKGNTATITYTGKSGVDHEKTVDDASIVAAMKPLLEGKKGGDRLLEDGDTTVTAEDVNAYLKKFDVTAKDIRGYRANDEMCKALKAKRSKGPSLPKDKKEREELLKKEFKEVLETVSEIVGHTPKMLGDSYLVPGLSEAYQKDGTVIKSLKQATKTPAEREDDAIGELVKPSPKLKPPRDDLRKKRIDIDPNETKEPPPDPDKVATTYLEALPATVASRWQDRFLD